MISIWIVKMVLLTGNRSEKGPKQLDIASQINTMNKKWVLWSARRISLSKDSTRPVKFYFNWFICVLEQMSIEEMDDIDQVFIWQKH